MRGTGHVYVNGHVNGPRQGPRRASAVTPVAEVDGVGREPPIIAAALGHEGGAPALDSAPLLDAERLQVEGRVPRSGTSTASPEDPRWNARRSSTCCACAVWWMPRNPGVRALCSC